MKKLFLSLMAITLLFSCNQTPATADTSTQTTSAADSVKALYERNLASLKTGIAAFENKQIDGWSATVADSAKWLSCAYGAKEATKDDWKKELSGILANWDSLKLESPNYLPGIDSVNHEFDGSVRYYGLWTGKHKSGKWTSSLFYGSYEFDKDGKVTSATEFFDIGGLLNAVKGK